MARPKRNADCHPDKPHKAWNLCSRCYNQAAYRANPNRIREWVAANPERVKANLRRAHLMRNYGTTPEAFDALVASQKGKCAICSKAAKLGQDHNHDTGKARGALCQTCNTLIGMAKESPAVLVAAIEYLNAWNAEAAA